MIGKKCDCPKPIDLESIKYRQTEQIKVDDSISLLMLSVVSENLSRYGS